MYSTSSFVYPEKLQEVYFSLSRCCKCSFVSFRIWSELWQSGVFGFEAFLCQGCGRRQTQREREAQEPVRAGHHRDRAALHPRQGGQHHTSCQGAQGIQTGLRQGWQRNDCRTRTGFRKTRFLQFGAQICGGTG